MSIHHLNCATLKPFGFVISDTASRFSIGNLVVRCLLIESDDGLILIDSGYGIDDRKNPELLLNGFMFLSNSSRDLTETAYHQIQSLGYDPANVKHIVQSHLHLDHAGGIPDFPQATIHVHRREYNGASNPQTFTERLCVSRHWKNVPQMQLFLRSLLVRISFSEGFTWSLSGNLSDSLTRAHTGTLRCCRKNRNEMVVSLC